jgi:prepilin-type processing-associated H-X9-DG protein
MVLALALVLAGGCGKSESKVEKAAGEGQGKAAEATSSAPSPSQPIVAEPLAPVEPDVRDLLPDGAVATVFYHGDRATMRQTALGDLWNEPGVKEFFDPVWEAIRTAIRENMKAEQGAPDLLALEPLLRTQAALGLYLQPAPAPAPAEGDDPAAARRQPSPKPGVVIVVQVGPEGSTVREGLLKGLKPLVGDAKTTEQNGVTLTPLAGGEMSYGFQGERFIAATKDMLDKAFDAKAAKVTASAAWKTLAAQSDLGREVVGLTLNVPQLLETLPQKDAGEANKVLSALGLSQAKGVALTWAPRGKAMAMTLFVATPTELGLMAALKTSPLDEKFLARCPKNAQAVLAVNLDLAKVYDGVMNSIVAPLANPAEANRAIREAEEAVGVKFRDELLASLDVGTMVTLTEGGLLMPNLTLMQKVKNEAATDAAMEKLFNVAGREIEKLAYRGFKIKESRGGVEPEPPPATTPSVMSTTYHGVKIKYANMFLTAPAYFVKDGLLVMAPSPVELKDFLDRQAEAGSILDHADFRLVRSGLTTQSPQAIFYSDSGTTFKKAYYLLPMYAALVSSVPDLRVKLDVGKLPGSDQVGRHLFGAAGAWQMTADGIKLESVSPTGVEGTTGLVALSMLAVMPTAVPKARNQANSVACSNNLRQIGISIKVYEVNHAGQPPASFDVLLKADELIPQVLKCPLCDGDRDCDYFYFPPKKNAPADCIVACDLLPHEMRGNPRNVLFGDGHVESVEAQRFEALLAERVNQAFAEAFRKAGAW